MKKLKLKSIEAMNRAELRTRASKILWANDERSKLIKELYQFPQRYYDQVLIKVNGHSDEERASVFALALSLNILRKMKEDGKIHF